MLEIKPFFHINTLSRINNAIIMTIVYQMTNTTFKVEKIIH